MRIVTVQEVIKSVVDKPDLWQGRCPILFAESALAVRTPMLSNTINELLIDVAEIAASVAISQCGPAKCGTCRGLRRLAFPS